MGVIFDEPRYPVLDKAPGFWKTASNFSLSDYEIWAGVTAISYPFGYVSGRAAGVPKQSALVAAVIGATAGFMLAYQNSAGRLMGFKPNDREVNTTLAAKKE